MDTNLLNVFFFLFSFFVILLVSLSCGDYSSQSLNDDFLTIHDVFFIFTTCTPFTDEHRLQE